MFRLDSPRLLGSRPSVLAAPLPSNKFYLLYILLYILPHVWKFFSNPRSEHDIREEDIELHIRSVSFTLNFVFYCFCFKLRMLYSLKYTILNLTFKGITRLHSNRGNKFAEQSKFYSKICLVGGLQECRDLTCVDTKKFATTSHAPPSPGL